MTGLRKLVAVFSMMEKGPKTIDGIPVFIDNAYYTKKNSTWDDYETNNNYFITGWYDTGDSEKKYYSYAPCLTENYGKLAARFFNDKESTSVDYWGPLQSEKKDFTSPGRFILASVYKPTAKDFYLRFLNGDYLFKGTNVT